LLALLIFTEIGRADPLDGWTWRNPLPTGNNLDHIAYGNGLFVAVGSAYTIVTSADGVNWVLRESGTTDRLSDIGYLFLESQERFSLRSRAHCLQIRFGLDSDFLATPGSKSTH